MPFPALEIPSSVGQAYLAVFSILFTLSAALAAGGAVFMVAIEIRGMGSMDPRWNDLARRCSEWVRGVATAVVGMTGAGVWIAVMVHHPRAAEQLHTIMRVPLLGALGLYLAAMILLYAYSRTWDRGDLSQWTHPALGIGAAACLWVTGAVVVSIQSFTLTTGGWLKSGAVLDAVFNSSFWPAFIIWVSSSLLIAGAAGLAYAAERRDEPWRISLIRGLGQWMAPSAFVAALAVVVWSVTVSGPPARGGVSSLLAVLVLGHLALGVMLIAIAVRRPEKFGALAAGVSASAVVALLGMVGWLHVEAHGAFLIQGVMYRNGILVREVDDLNRRGLWRSVAWRKSVVPPAKAELGAFSFRAQCRVCHADWSEGPKKARLPKFRYAGEVYQFLQDFNARHSWLPQFVGTSEEARAVADHVELLLRKAGLVLVSRPKAPTLPKSKPKPQRAKAKAPPKAAKPAKPAPLAKVKKAPEAKKAREEKPKTEKPKAPEVRAAPSAQKAGGPATPEAKKTPPAAKTPADAKKQAPGEAPKGAPSPRALAAEKKDAPKKVKPEEKKPSRQEAKEKKPVSSAAPPSKPKQAKKVQKMKPGPKAPDKTSGTEAKPKPAKKPTAASPGGSKAPPGKDKTPSAAQAPSAPTGAAGKRPQAGGEKK